jgi:hypothetical protein
MNKESISKEFATNDESNFAEREDVTYCQGRDNEFFQYDPEGTMALSSKSIEPSSSPMPSGGTVTTPLTVCSLDSINGSWYIHILPKGHLAPIQRIRGPMRIEVGEDYIRISGDIYVTKLFLGVEPVDLDKPLTKDTMVIKLNSYPQLPFKEYRWYFRSLGVKFSLGTIEFNFERHLWDANTEEFTMTDNGWMRLSCKRSSFITNILPRPTLKMTGEAMIGGTLYNVVAYKTSRYYRGCHIEIDVMQNRNWVSSATSCDGNQTHTLTGVYQNAGLDFRAVVSTSSIPDDPTLTTAELYSLLTTHRDITAADNNWRLWLLVGSRIDGTLGLMFDDAEPYREGAVGFYDVTLPDLSIIESSARGMKLGEVPLAFLRTLIHEAGHAFNLYHPKSDVHGVPVGTTIMNQTGDVMGFATTSDPYPCNATFAFNNHNRTSLIHAPDPQIAPGWKRFGWGHGSLWSGVAEPIDAAGLNPLALMAQDLMLKVEVPKEVFRGEYVMAKITLTNIGTTSHSVTTALNLSEGDLRLIVTDPNGDTFEVRDIVIICADRQMTDLMPGESIVGNVQIFYTNRGLTFDHLGHYVIEAELHTGDREGSMVKSAPVELIIRPAITEEEREMAQITTDPAVGRSFALGDFGPNTETRKKLDEIQAKYGDTITGTAVSLVLANSVSRDFRDLKTGHVIRQSDEAEVNKSLEVAVRNKDALTVARVATSVAVPGEKKTPVLSLVRDKIKGAAAGRYENEDISQADELLSDFIS